MKGVAELEVTEKMTASALISGGLPVFATPYLVALMEYAACNAIEKYIDEGFTSVGSGFNFVHSAATPVGLVVRAEAEVTNVDRRAVTFRVTAYDGKGVIGSGTHTRFIVSIDSFLKKARRKLL